jgi:hypothetical protein
MMAILAHEVQLFGYSSVVMVNGGIHIKLYTGQTKSSRSLIGQYRQHYCGVSKDKVDTTQQ